MNFAGPACRKLLAILVFGALIVAGPPACASQAPTGPNELPIPETGVTLRFPQTWSAEHHAGMHRLIRVAPNRVPPLTADERKNLPVITTSTEARKSQAETILRLRQIAAESATSPKFLAIGGWPALQRSESVAKPRVGLEDKPLEEAGTWVHVTTAIAAGTILFRMDGFADEKADPVIASEMEVIGRGVTFAKAGSPIDSRAAIQELEKAGPLHTTPPPTPGVRPKFLPQSMPGTTRSRELAAPARIGSALNLQLGTEPEIAVSTDGTRVVVVQQCRYVSSGDSGATFPFSGVMTNCNGGDSSVAYGKSGNFYEASIGIDQKCTVNPGECATAINRSTDGGHTFTFLSYSVTCATSVCGFGGIPDQEHVAADRFTEAPGGDQVYVAFRLGPGFDLSCSTNSGASFGNETQVNNGFSDFPRLTVGQDGFVYVVSTNGSNIELDKYSSCASGLVHQFHNVVATGTSGVVCPVPGLDRCNDGNVLRSPTVAVDDTNASHVFVAYAVSTVPGANENVIVQDSLDGGNTWGATGHSAQLNSPASGRRFMPWVCSIGGAAYVSWYDRRNATPSSDDLTDYFAASASLNSGSLVAGGEIQINSAGTSDAQCAGGGSPGTSLSWPCGVRAAGDATSCSFQPQLAGRCLSSGLVCGRGASGSGVSCDLNHPNCATGESCTLGFGVPKYGDYNGNACAAGRLYTIWGSATAQPGAPPPVEVTLFFASTAVCCQPSPSTVSLALTSGSNPAAVATSLTFTATVSPGTATGTMTFFDGTTAVSGGIPISAGSAAFSTSSLSAGSHSVTAQYAGDANFSGSVSSALVEVIQPAPDFSLAAVPAAATIKAGQSASFQVTVTPTGGFNQTINFSCAGVPGSSQCLFNPSSLTPNGGSATTTLTITTVAPSSLMGSAPPQSNLRIYALSGALGFLGMGILCSTAILRRRLFVCWTAICVLAFIASCGGQKTAAPGTQNPGTPAGTSNITVSATSASGTHTAAISLAVTN